MENFFLVFAVKKKDLNARGALYRIICLFYHSDVV